VSPYNVEHGSLEDFQAMDRPLSRSFLGVRRAVFNSVTVNALSSALDGLAARQRAIASNIANVNTPGYRAKIVSFEGALSQSVAAGSGLAGASQTDSTAPTNVNGNNVSLDSETLNNIETVLRYQFATRAVNMEFDATSAALRTS
jgi:flagellar basal-body rod protein FlgB